MNAFEQKLLAALPGFLAIAEEVAPIFIHSSKATVVLNATEEFAGLAVAQFAQMTMPAPAAAPAPLAKTGGGITVVQNPT